MSDSLTLFFALQTDEERRHWLAANQPTRTEPLLQALWAEANRREYNAPHTLTPLISAAHVMAQVWGDQAVAAVALRLEAAMHRALGRYEEALQHYQQAIALYQSLGQEEEAARSVVGPLDALLYLGRYQEALDLALWAAPTVRAGGDQAALGRLLVNQGNLYARLADYRAAQSCYAEARQLFTALGNSHHTAMVAANEANVLTNLNDFRQAEALYTAAREPLLTAEMTGAVAQIDHNRAYLAFAQGDYQRALQLFQQARTAFLAQQSDLDVAYVDLYRCEIYLALNLFADALALAQSAYPIFMAAQMQWEAAQLLLCQAAAALQSNHPTDAQALLLQARQLFTDQQNNYWVAVTDLYQATFALRSGQPAAARLLVTRVQPYFVAAQTDHRVAQCAILLGEAALAENQLPLALTHFQEGLTAAGNGLLPAVSYQCHVGLARLYKQQGEIALATTHYHEAIDDIERLQGTIGAEDYKIAFRRDKLQVYEELIFLYLEHKTPAAAAAAFATVESAKARTLVEAITQLSDKAAAGGGAMQADYETLKQELNWYYNQLHGATPEQTEPSPDQQRGLLRTIYERETALEALRQRWRQPDLAPIPHNRIWTVTAPQLQALLPADTLLLEFYLTAQRLIIFGVTAEALWTAEIALSRSELGRLLDGLRFQMNKFSYAQSYHEQHRAVLLASANELFYELYQTLIQPIAHSLQARHLIIVPHDLLHYLPFHAFYDGQHYLAERYQISYAPSATILHRVLIQQDLPSTTSPLILGLADTSIPCATTEVAALQQIFPTAELRLGEQATTQLLLTEQQRPPFLHIATHALFRADTPFLSALKLADGWLTVEDLYHLTTVAPLVTLSACETARSEVAAGDELVGLCRGFFSAGAQTLVVSLWMAEDRTTATFMQYFYAALRRGQAVYQALHTAQLTIFQDYPHPYYWAPFIMTGNPLLRLPTFPT
ncbi:MAG: CHAT domain-containing protein [Caldilinea sp. CFX5]|nr:CHAT domain-containing protein [Caldilinea sp. CFX5]